MRILALPLMVLLVMISETAQAADTHQPGAHQNQMDSYAGQEQREIKSLSAQDMDDLINGRGWGLAKAAELNGMPGPIHLLEFAKELELSVEQISAIEGLFSEMKKQAIPLGLELVELERRLDDGFARHQMTRDNLRQTLDEIAATRSNLRFVHLSVHLQTPPLLSAEQIRAYNQLRGYGVGATPHAMGNHHKH